jgi:hypothetical protein
MSVYTVELCFGSNTGWKVPLLLLSVKLLIIFAEKAENQLENVQKNTRAIVYTSAIWWWCTIKMLPAPNSILQFPFSFTSLGAAVDRTINNGTSSYVFKFNGVVHHRIGTLLPQQGTQPRFAQLYIHDTENETYNRLNLFENADNSPVQPDPDVALSLMNMLNENNQLIKAFWYAQESIE